MSCPPLAANDDKLIEIKYNKKESYEIDSNGKKYNFKISNNVSIIFFEIEEINAFPKQEFNIHLNLEQLCKINKFFLQFDNLNEISDSIKKIIDNKNAKIEKREKEMILTLINPMNQKEFNLSLPLKENDIKAEISSLNSYVIQLNEKYENLDKRVKYLEKKIEEICSVKQQSQTKEKSAEPSEMFCNSSIVKNDEIDLICSWMEKMPKKFKLLLDSRFDNDLTSTFYNKCNQKYPTIIFVKSNDGYRFGGYTSIFWPKDGYKNDIKSFLFSLDFKKKYNCIKNDWAIYHEPNEYFSFGNNIYIYNNCTKNSSNYIGTPFSYDIPKNYELNGGKNDFIVESYEVYKIEY